MQSLQHIYPGMHIKGGLLRARFLFVVLHHGSEVWARILERLPEQDRATFADIAIDNWYELDTLDRVDRAIAEELDGDGEKVFDQLGEFSATSSLAGPYSSLLNADVHSFLRQSAIIHRSYQDFGSATYEVLGDMKGLLKIKYDTPPPMSFCISGTAYFRHAVELCGVRSSHIKHSSCCTRGNPVCEFYISWQV